MWCPITVFIGVLLVVCALVLTNAEDDDLIARFEDYL